jgi:acetyl-CoA carboxylase biotin carboxyl carrier protein
VTQIEDRSHPRPGHDGPADPAPTLADLAELCRSAAQLAQGSHGPLSRLRVSCGEISVELEWARDAQAVTVVTAGPPAPAEPPPATAAADTGPELMTVKAPIVGTFYHAPEPGADPFVKVGDLVEPAQTVGIVEAMKLMNPIEAGQAGRVVEILVPDSTAVEFAQPLIALRAVTEEGP